MSVNDVRNRMWRVQFQRAGKLYDFFYKDLELRVGEYILVDSRKVQAQLRSKS